MNGFSFDTENKKILFNSETCSFAEVLLMGEVINMNNDEMLKRMEQMEKMITDYAAGVQNVFNEVYKVRKQLDLMKYLQDRCGKEMIPVDEAQLVLRIKSYPMNIRVDMKIETNFGEISYVYDYPSFNEDKLSQSIHNVYFKLLQELYDAHEERGGHFIGEKNCKEWMDKNRRTIIKKESSLSPRCK